MTLLFPTQISPTLFLQTNTQGASMWVSHEYKLQKLKFLMSVMDERLYNSFSLKLKQSHKGSAD